MFNRSRLRSLKQIQKRRKALEDTLLSYRRKYDSNPNPELREAIASLDCLLAEYKFILKEID